MSVGAVVEFEAPTKRLPTSRNDQHLIGRCGPLPSSGFPTNHHWHFVRWKRATKQPMGFWIFLGAIGEPFIKRRWGYVAACGTTHMGSLKGFAYGLPSCSKCLERLYDSEGSRIHSQHRARCSRRSS